MDARVVPVGGSVAGSSKTIAAAHFKAQCLRIIEQMSRDREPVTMSRSRL
jgi:hypothetical protein